MVTLRAVALGVLALIVSFMCPGCDDGTIVEEVVCLSGRVEDMATGLPLDSAWVVLDDTLTGAVFYTDTAGEFALASTPFKGPRILIAGRIGYLTAVVDTFENIQRDTGGILVELDRAEE
ncbi:MAG TPA: hypothetical protein VM118_09745 [Acidobacteriota bacterium]|nr:hypothetical protein [Acidobacteriota bacterium]